MVLGFGDGGDDGVMECVDVRTSVEYKVIVGRGILEQAGSLAADLLKTRRVLVWADDVVGPLYLERVASSFRGAGFWVETGIFPAGEGWKRLPTVEGMLERADLCGMTRADAFIALGGGVTGDMVGLAAALYLRGIDFIQIPTTLLAMVDASVGGKTAVNLESGKNLCGAFHQPRMVICDPEVLKTLPEAILAEGMAEVIKHGAICSPALLDRIQAGADPGDLVADNIRIKSGIVSRDEKEHGERKLLNFGHTFGHAIEKLSGFSIFHGEGVAVGMMIAALAAERHGICTSGVYRELREMLMKAKLPVTTKFTAAEIAENAMNDKKRAGDTLTLVLPAERGRCMLYPVGAGELKEWIACCDGEVTGV